MKRKKPNPGPKAERLTIPIPWEEAVRRALRKTKPPGGWPKPTTKG